MKLSTRRKFPAFVLGLLAAVLLACGILCATGCQASYWDRGDPEAAKKAEARLVQIEGAVATLNGQKANLETALVTAKTALQVANDAGLSADKITAAQKVVDTVEAKREQVFLALGNLDTALKDAKDAAAKAKDAGTGISAAETDAATAGAILNGIGSLFGPAGALGATALSGILGLLVRAKSKQVTAAQAVIRSIDAAKASTAGGAGVVDFNNPETKALLASIQGEAGQKFVDDAQPY